MEDNVPWSGASLGLQSLAHQTHLSRVLIEPIDVHRIRAEIDHVKESSVELDLMAVRMILPLWMRTASIDGSDSSVLLVGIIRSREWEDSEV